MKKIINKLPLVVVALPIFLIFLIVTLLVVSPLINEIILSTFSKQINNLPLPQYIELIEKKAVCGKLNGNGNGMDFFACILVKSDMTIDELKQYYKGKKFRAAKNKDHNIDFKIISVNGYKLDTEYVEHADIYFDKLKNLKNYDGFYAVMIYDGGYWAGFDIRGN